MPACVARIGLRSGTTSRGSPSGRRGRVLWLARAVVKVTVDAAHRSSLTSARRDLHELRMCRHTAVVTVNAGEMFGANLRRSQGICWNRNLGTAGHRDSSSVTGATSAVGATRTRGFREIDLRGYLTARSVAPAIRTVGSVNTALHGHPYDREFLAI